MNLPEGYQAVMPYLILKDAADFIEFAKSVLDAKEKFREMRDENTIAHAQLFVGESTIMVAEATEQWQQNTAGMFAFVENADKAYKKAIELGSESVMEPADMPYGRSSGIKDPFGNTWWLTHPL